LAAIIDDRLQVRNLKHLQSELTEIGLTLPNWPAVELEHSFTAPKSIEIEKAGE
jgi:hypothetical protein